MTETYADAYATELDKLENELIKTATTFILSNPQFCGNVTNNPRYKWKRTNVKKKETIDLEHKSFWSGIRDLILKNPSEYQVVTVSFLNRRYIYIPYVENEDTSKRAQRARNISYGINYCFDGPELKRDNTEKITKNVSVGNETYTINLGWLYRYA